MFLGPFQDEPGSDGIGDTIYIIDEKNADNYPLMDPWTPPDIAVVNTTTSKNVIGKGFTLDITAIVKNQGNKIEDLNVTLYANEIAITSQTFLLKSGNSLIYEFTWDTTGLAKGNYTIWAYLIPALGELDTQDNNFTDGWIIVAMPYDITGADGYPDGKCDVRDVATVARLFGVNYPDPRYDPNCDLTGPTFGVPDGKIDIRDIALIAKHFGDIDP